MNRLPTTIQNEIYINSFYKHPFIVNYNNVKGYILIKKITELIEDESGYRDFDRHLKPTAIEIDEMGNNEYSVSIPNIRYDETQNESYNNAKKHHYRFLIETLEEFDDRVKNAILQNICNTSPELLFLCLRDDAQKEVEEQEPREPREQNETTYHNDNCPVCFEEYENEIIKKVAICGHCLCNDCWEHIINSNNSICPECREVWDEATDEDEINIQMEDIEMFIENEDDDMLLRIINQDELVERILQTEDPCEILGGYEDIDDNIEGFDTPLKYRQLLEGGNEFKILWMRD